MKKQLREKLMAQEAALPSDYVKMSNEGIYKNILSLPEFQGAKAILFFYSVWNEPSTIELINYALDEGKIATLPYSMPKGIMKAQRVLDLSDLVPGRYDIPSPTDDMEEILPEHIDFVLVPSVAFDREGYRLGHGGGYYDRYLPRTGAFKCGIARERMLVEKTPREDHDVRVDCLVTENEIIRF